jgi:uncharacterized protein YndB with AHSA1/START domain
MPSAQRSVRIARPVADVFAFFTDPANEQRWRSSHLKEFQSHEPLAVGTRVRQVLAGPMGRDIDADIEVTELDQDARYAFRTIAGPVRPTGAFDFRPVAEGTEVTLRLDATLGGLKKLLMGASVQKAMNGEVAALDRAKAVLEGSAEDRSDLL